VALTGRTVIRNRRRASARARLRVAVVGAGKVGLVLGKILSDNGATITCVVSRTRGSASAGRRFLGCRNSSTRLAGIPRETDLVFIATPHDAVAGVATGLGNEADLDWPATSVCHASGMLTADVLAPLRVKGATVFSFHPLQTFPRDFPPRKIVESAKGITYGVDGEPAAVRKASQLARLLGGRVVVVPPHLRVFYHAACVVASNHLTALLADLARMSGRLGFEPRDALAAFHPIIDATVDNVYRTSPARALSGPVARGGVQTVRGHLEAVSALSPDLLPYFVRMTAETVRLATEKGALSGETVSAFRSMLETFSETSGPHGGMQ
jgi:predicted short-subunit dehydrogenase-like oxidoreductase (DUF2520 family)